MSSTVPSATPINAPTKSASPSAASGATNGRSSYANATKGAQSSPSANASSGSAAAVGGLALSQHARSNSGTPVNGRPSAPPSVPSGPAIVSSTNGAPAGNSHNRAPSVTITPQSTSYVANGAASVPSRPNISFGSIGAAPSPNMSNSTPQMHHSTLSGQYGAQLPARSPSPIPPPQVSSGGRPPSSLAGQGAVNFGSLPGADGSDQSLPLRPGIPSGPGAGPQAQHLRRESSQSAHSDNLNRNYPPPNGRGNGGRPPFNNQQFPGAGPTHSPNMFRPQMATTPQRMNATPFQQQMRPANSPYQATRSPAMTPHAQPHMPNMQNGAPMHPYGGYPPQMHGQNMYMPPAYSGYEQYPGYPPNGGFMPQAMYGQVPHQSMSPGPSQYRPQGPYAPGPYPTAPSAGTMSRQASQSGVDPRPTSSMGHSPAPQGPAPGASPSPGPAASSFSRPKKTSAIKITNADGEVIDFKKSVQSPSTATAPRAPAVVSSGGAIPAAATPPRVVTPSAQQHVRTESTQQKTAEERKREFEEAVRRTMEPEKKPEEAPKTPAVKEEEPVKPEEKAEEPAPAEKGETEAERKAREEDEEMERLIAEMEEQERAEEEREKEFQRKKAEKAAEEKRKADEAAANAEEEMKRLEREAEEREEAKAKGKTDTDSDAEARDLFSQLKKNTMFGPGAAGADATSGTSTPGSDSPMPPPAVPASASRAATLPTKSKPAALKLETTKTVEPAQPTAGMQALKTARFLSVRNDAINYPEGIKSPNPALNQSTKGSGQRYDNNFLLQFREVFKEKPSVDWDKVLKDTVGDGTDSARPPNSARTPSGAVGGRSMSSRGGGAPAMGMMGNFGAGGRTLPAGTTSEQRFQASSGARPGMAGPFGGFQAGGRPGVPFPMGAPGMARTPSSQSIQGMNSPRNASQRGKGGSRRGGPHPAQEAEMRKKMPLTADMQIAPLEASGSGWKPTSIGQPQQGAAVPSGHMAPDMVQRKVKAALNKMTPEKFDKITNDILAISSQSKDETDGRTLRQVIQLTFEKACDEAHWSSMYAKFCERMLHDMTPDIRDEGVTDKNGQVVVGGALFRKYLLNRCQEEFERGWEVNLPEMPEGQNQEAVMLSDEYYVAAAAKRRGLGLIQFIGELYKLSMLTLRIMHECVVKLLNFEGAPDEAAVESLIKLLRTIGATMDSDPKGHSMMDTYIDRIQTIMKFEGLPSRIYYMLLDTVEMRRKNWAVKDALKGPKTIQEIREEAAAQQAAQEADRQKSRGGPGGRPPPGRGDVRSFSGAMPPPDYRSTSVAMDDLKKLSRNARSTNTSGAGLGPGSLLSSSRNGSRRGGLGPRVGEDSQASSRTNTPPVEKKESANTFSALAALDGDHPDDVASPPSQHASPAVAKAQPAEAAEAEAAKAS